MFEEKPRFGNKHLKLFLLLLLFL